MTFEKGPIAWMANNPVAANLSMGVVLVGGVLAALGMKQEVFPEFELDAVRVFVPYPGASPEEVEQGIVLAVEEAVRPLDGVKRVYSVANEGSANATIDLLRGADGDRVLADVKSAVDRITSFPEEAEKPTTELLSRRRQVISLIVAGPESLRTLHQIAEKARLELLRNPQITQVELSGIPPLEIAVEVPRETLDAYGLTLNEVAQQVTRASVELPGGKLKTKSGELLVRVADRRLTGEAFEDIVLKGTAEGSLVRLGEVAQIRDGYEDTGQASYFNGQPAVRITAYRVGDETPTEVSKAVRAYAQELQEGLPKSMSVVVWDDDSERLQDRIDLLVRNATQGLFLVLLVLTLFLKRQLAGWVALGIPISFLGAFIIMSTLDVSINLVSLFALIVTLGMVVDDAIIIGENIYTKAQLGMAPGEAAKRGAQEMAVPVTFSILTTIVAFAPLFFVPGVIGKIFRIIPVVVVAVLSVSLFESFFILPAHLRHGVDREGGRFSAFFRPIDRVQRYASGKLTRFVEGPYRRWLSSALTHRYVTLSAAVAFLIVIMSTVVSGIVPFTFFPNLEGDVVTASARLPFGAPVERTDSVRAKIEQSAREALKQSGGSRNLKGMFSRLGESALGVGSHLVSVELELVPSEQRDFSSETFAERWRDALPDIGGLESLSISGGSGPSAGRPVDVQLSHPNASTLAKASGALAQALTTLPELVNIENSYAVGKPQLDFSLRPQARTFGLSGDDVARALRASFFGAEALREQRGRNEIKVMVRLPENQRDSIEDIEMHTVPTAEGAPVPLGYVAEVTEGRSKTEIRREEGQRVVNVSAELAAGVVTPRPVLESLTATTLPKLRSRYPGLETSFVGQHRERSESLSTLGPNFLIALCAIFALLAIPFRSYIQPAIIMSAIPFGMVGAVLGHMLLGYTLSISSMFGIIALSGVVVNDSLVLVDAVNGFRKDGSALLPAVIEGGKRRFRPILLTSLTTFLGLMPMCFETSRQARFLIPMAISLGFGSLFVTAIVLIVVPALYVAVEDAIYIVRERKLPPTDHGFADSAPRAHPSHAG